MRKLIIPIVHGNVQIRRPLALCGVVRKNPLNPPPAYGPESLSTNQRAAGSGWQLQLVQAYAMVTRRTGRAWGRLARA